MWFFVLGPILLPHSLLTLGWVPRRYSGSHTDRCLLVLPTSTAKMTARDAHGWGPSPAHHFWSCTYILFIWETLPSIWMLHMPISQGPASSLLYCEDFCLHSLWHPALPNLRGPNQSVHVTNGGATFNSHPTSCGDVWRLLPSLQWVKAIKWWENNQRGVDPLPMDTLYQGLPVLKSQPPDKKIYI